MVLQILAVVAVVAEIYLLLLDQTCQRQAAQAAPALSFFVTP
jgi:hypothetical protein